MRMKAGEVNNRLTAVRQTRVGTKSKAGRWLFVCDCGSEIEAAVPNVRNGHTKSCGCLNREIVTARNIKHGAAGTVEHRAWTRMRARCVSDEPHKARSYKSRGVTVCAEWDHFPSFLECIGPAPSPKHSVDRIDNDEGYKPGNVRWATRSQQMKNRRPFKRARRAEIVSAVEARYESEGT